MIDMMKTQSDKGKIPGPSKSAKRPAELQQQSLKIKLQNCSYFKVICLGRP